MPVFCNADMRCHESVVLAPRRARQEDSKFEASLDYIGKHCHSEKKKKKEERKGEGGKEERKGRREELMEKGREEN